MSGVVYPRGKVYLLGAGIGQSSFLTLQARAILATAEVLLYDALVDSQIFSLVPKTCVLVDVGKRGDNPAPSKIRLIGYWLIIVKRENELFGSKVVIRGFLGEYILKCWP